MYVFYRKALLTKYKLYKDKKTQFLLTNLTNLQVGWSKVDLLKKIQKSLTNPPARQSKVHALYFIRNVYMERI